ncbi:dihydrofolate reductase family protein [Naasia lichenicola]|uniref:Dihydrofolate reductase n=1 Tax=Naasia lichenicola TaxID=2565933 RepID=A0A4S4FL21_9MICO|nr:dihydrofolate reductase family protein [Naasia lichenicola]THG29886.1 dihydrofolate reductase [Naasia lichenicola]
MSRIVVQEFVTLDGVAQAPGGSEEDLADGFEHGGWQMDYDAVHDRDDEGGPIIMDWESRTEALLLGRKTYEIWAGAWGVWDEHEPGSMGELTRTYNRVPKHVASRTLTELGWKNSHLLGDDVPTAVQKLREEPGGEIRVWGSLNLIRTLGAHDLVDQYRLAVYPIVLGTGKKLFAEGFRTSTFDVVESRVLKSGVIITVLRRRNE